MPITVTPLGVRCNLQCGYCYEDPQRDAGNDGTSYDLEAIKLAVAEMGRASEPFLLFGGEPLLLPKRVLEDLWSWGMARSGQNSVQTNGTLIDSDHIALFKTYKVGVGISMDGPGALNDSRWNRNLENTRKSTARTEAAISLLCEAGIPPSLIVTLHRLNATGEHLETLVQWFRSLSTMGIKRIGVHLLEVESEQARAKYQLSDAECINAILRLRGLRRELCDVSFSLLEDLEHLMMGQDSRVRCIWQSCDPYTTPAVRGIGGHGECTKCSRVNKEGVDFMPSSSIGYERYLALHQTPQENGGCKDCRFFLMCRGQCPGTAIDGDWRNRSEQCRTWTQIFEVIESELLAAGKLPLSISPLRTKLEAELCELWVSGRSASVEQLLQRRRRPDNPTRQSFELPPFSRMAWASATGKDIWETALRQTRTAVMTAEWMWVTLHKSRVALVTALADEVVGLMHAWQSYGLWSFQINIEQAERIPFTKSRLTSPYGSAVLFAVGDAEGVRSLKLAIAERNLYAAACVLGYPECCATTLANLRSDAFQIDTTWQVARPFANAGDVSVIGNHSANSLLSALGIRAVSHLPCGFRCGATEERATELRNLVKCELPQHLEAHEAIDSILEWPAEWSALHGISEVKLPVLKISGITDWTPDRRTIRWMGNVHPSGAAYGLEFPYARKSMGATIRVISSTIERSSHQPDSSLT